MKEFKFPRIQRAYYNYAVASGDGEKEWFFDGEMEHQTLAVRSVRGEDLTNRGLDEFVRATYDEFVDGEDDHLFKVALKKPDGEWHYYQPVLVGDVPETPSRKELKYFYKREVL